METEKKLLKWLKYMEYPGEIPKYLSRMCNPATNPLWTKICLIESRQHVDHILKNLIIKRFENVDLDDLDYFESNLDKSLLPITHIETWREKQRLANEIEDMQKQIADQEIVIEQLENSTKQKYIQLENAKQTPKDLQCKLFLFEQKRSELEKELTVRNEKLTLAKGLTPVEDIDVDNQIEILNTLTKCAEKLELMMLKENQKNVSRTSNLSLSMSSLNASNLTLNDAPNKWQNMLYNYNSRSGKTPSKNSFLKNSLLKSASKKSSFHINQGLNDSALGTLNDSFNDDLLSDNTNTAITKLVETDLEKLLHSFPRHQIIKKIGELNKDLLQNVSALNQKNAVASSGSKKQNSENMKAIYIMHIEKSLDIYNSKFNIKLMEKQIPKFENSLFEIICHGNTSDKKDVIRMCYEEAGLNAVKSHIQKEISALRQKVQFTRELEAIEKKKKRIQQKWERFEMKIDQKLAVLEETYHCILNNKWMQHLINTPLISDLDCFDRLLDNSYSEELNLFLNFPFDYNKRTSANGKSVYFRDTFNHSFKALENANSNLHNLFSTMLTSPSFVPELEIMQILNKKTIIELAKDLENVTMPPCKFKHNVTKLEEREEYISPLVVKLNNLKEDIANKTNSSSKMNDYIEFWTHMPIRNYISNERLVKDKDYKYYEKICEDLIKNL